MRDSDRALINKASNRCKVTILLFGLPHALENIPSDVNVLMVGADRPEAQIAAVNAILGKHDVNGRLAISLTMAGRSRKGFDGFGNSFRHPI